MAALTVLTVDLDGVTFATETPAGGGDTFVNTGREVLYVANGSGGSIDVTFTGQSASNFGVTSNKVVAVGAGVTKVIGPFLTGWFDTAAALVAVQTSSQASITVAVLKVTDTVTAL